ncbi:MAG: phage head-tail connector protein [Bryobacteraceae bacterium]
MTPLCTLDQVKAALGLAADEASEDSRLTFLIGMASGQIADYCGRDFELAEIANELHDGDGSALLPLEHTPIVAVTALEIDGQAVEAAEVKVYPEYIRFGDSAGYNARLRSYSRVFPEGTQNVKVSYRAGYEEIPVGIANACVVQVIYLMNTLAKQGLLSETNQVAQSTTAYAQEVLAPEAKVACNRYRKPGMAVI